MLRNAPGIMNKVTTPLTGRRVRLIAKGVDPEPPERALAPLIAGDAVGWNNRGVQRAGLGQPQEALDCYDRALAIAPEFAEAWLNRGLALATMSRHELAVASLDRVIALRPHLAEAFYNRGISLGCLGKAEAAIESFERAGVIDPQFAAAFTNKGLALQGVGRLHDALSSLARAATLEPRSAQVWFNLGVVQAQARHLDAAVQSYDRAIAVMPSHALAWNNRGNALREQGRLDAALQSFDAALAQAPALAEAWNGRGVTLARQRRSADALHAYERALAFKPDFVEAQVNRAMELLLAGRLDEGWVAYEARLQRSRPGMTPAGFERPPWTGTEPVDGRTVLLGAEQGLGDTIQFARYASCVASRGARVVLRVPQALVRLMRGMAGVSEVIATADPLPAHDFHASLMSLPRVFGTRLDSIPTPQGYLSIDRVLAKAWRQRVDSSAGFEPRPVAPSARPFRVGLVWSGGHRPGQPETWSVNERRNVPLALMASVLMPEVEFYSLQKGDAAAAERVAFCAARPGAPAIIDLTAAIDDFADTAAFIEQLDLVISVDTSTAHLAGALGKPVWILNRFDACWRWLEGREDSPWYASARLYRQTAPGDWGSVLARVRSDLEAMVGARSDRRPAVSEPAPEPVPEPVPESMAAASGPVSDEARARAEDRFRLGLASHQKGSLDEAQSHYRAVLQTLPAHVDSLHLLGVALAQQGRKAEAVGWIDQAIARDPRHAAFHYNRGLALKALKRHAEAIASYDRALAIDPAYVEAWADRGVALVDSGAVEAGLASFERAIALRPAMAEVWCNRGLALAQLGRRDAALDSYDRAVALRPDYADAHWNKSLLLLLHGDGERGWPLYEWRWRRPPAGIPRPPFKEPLWLGQEPLAGKTLLLHGEQGLGDSLQFCRFAPLVAARGARVVLEVPAPLVDLMGGLAGVSQRVAAGDPLPVFDMHCPLMSLPLALGMRLDSLPGAGGYLRSDGRRVAAWARKLGPPVRPRIGIAWSGNPDYRSDAARSLAFAQLAQALPEGEFDYLVLQRDIRATDREALAARADVRLFAEGFSDTAALMELVDLVISTDTSIAHLAGALGKTLWLLLAQPPDWRWMLERTDTPWYASARLYRQHASGDWREVLARVRADLSAHRVRAPDDAAAGSRTEVA